MPRWRKVDRFRLPTGYGTEWSRQWSDGARAGIGAVSMGRSSVTGGRLGGAYREYVWTLKAPGSLFTYASGTATTVRAAMQAADRAHREWVRANYVERTAPWRRRPK